MQDNACHGNCDTDILFHHMLHLCNGTHDNLMHLYGKLLNDVIPFGHEDLLSHPALHDDAAATAAR